MPFTSRIRKDILKALEEQIIPPLWQQQVSLGYVAPPLCFPTRIETKLLSRRLPLQDKAISGFPIRSTWSKAKLLSTSHAYLSFIYEGKMEERTLITAAQASEHRAEKGVFAVRCQAPAALFFPANTPRNSGTANFINTNSEPRSRAVKILQIAFRDEILVHIHTENEERVEATHSLLVKDPHLLNLAALFEEKLQSAAPLHQEAARATLLALLLHLRDKLSSHTPQLANTSHPPIPDFKLLEGRGQEIYREAIHFIQTHLHEKLSLPFLARKLHISATHLNRLFRRFSGITVMHYVRRQRIEAAKTMLIINQESVKEIALLLNFKSSSAFCSAFRQETGLTPKQFYSQSKE